MKHFLSHELYGKRPTSHRGVHRVAPGWWFVEVGSWTLEVEPGPKLECLLVALMPRAAVL